LFPDGQTQPTQLLPDGHQRSQHLNPITGRPLPAVHLPRCLIQALTEAGLEVVRVMRSSISIADPNGGKNIRLKGAFYEQSFT
ncbi:hypothetical protein ACSLPB_29615, partial [Escherichia coli]